MDIRNLIRRGSDWVRQAALAASADLSGSRVATGSVGKVSRPTVGQGKPAPQRSALSIRESAFERVHEMKTRQFHRPLVQLHPPPLKPKPRQAPVAPPDLGDLLALASSVASAPRIVRG
jgi:hypothetical protein